MDKLSQMVLMGAAGKKGLNSNTPIGTFVEGGFLAGFINQGGQKYAIIVAPRASGQSSTTRQYKTSQTTSPAATRTLNNGSAATAAMVSAGGHPSAAYCNNLTINGFSDWYMPARDELELCYRNLKPSTGTNSTTNRDKSFIAYPEGDDASSDTHGRNRNSNPARAAYTSGTPGNPVQTTVTEFITGNTEAFFTTFSYWSSTEFNAANAWSQGFTTGFQGGGATKKTNTSILVRAVRRVAV